VIGCVGGAAAVVSCHLNFSSYYTTPILFSLQNIILTPANSSGPKVAYNSCI
jgi:hypothetical protein